MALTITPGNGHTFAFGNVQVGTSSPTPINAVFHATLSVDQASIDAIAITGPDAAQFSFMDTSFSGGYYDGDTGTGSVVFTPTSIAAFTATLGFTTRTFRAGRQVSQVNFSYPLTGSGVSNGVPSNEPNALLQSQRFLLVPSLGTTGKVLSFYDSANLNDVLSASTYVFKSEDMIVDRVPTLRRVIVTYFDLGVANLIVTVSGVDDTGALVTANTTITIGTVAANGLLCTAYADLTVTGYRPQVKLVRSANGGQVAISHVVATGTVEKQVTL